MAQSNKQPMQGALLDEQLDALTGPTPEDQIRSRAGGWGGAMNYISGEYATRRLMSAFNGGHRVTILNQEWKETSCITTVRLEYQINNGEWAHIDEVGSSVAKRDGKYEQPDFGNTAKASMTDAIKRAAMRLGIGLDLYEKSAESAPMNTSGKKSTSFAKDDAVATEGQIKYLRDLVSKANPEWDIEWLAKTTGIPVEELGTAEELGTNLPRNLASAAIESLKEIAYAKN